MRDCKICRIYSDVQDKVSSVIFAKKIAEEERKRKITLVIVLVSVAVAVVAAIATAAIYLSSKNADGERRGKVLVEKIKSKLPQKKAVCDCEELADELCECEEEAPAEVAEETVEE